MSDRLPLPTITLARHGETEWSASGRHTSSTDIPLTDRGAEKARGLADRLRGRSFPLVLTSPLLRARQTCDLAGFGGVAQVDDDLVEFRYGDYEGKTTPEIRRDRPGWSLYRDGCPGGDTLAGASARADRVVARLRKAGGDALIFSHAHFLRCLAARWLGLEVGDARLFALSTASLSVLGYEHDLTEPAIRLWNDQGPDSP